MSAKICWIKFIINRSIADTFSKKMIELAMKMDCGGISIRTFELNDIAHGLKLVNNRALWKTLFRKLASEYTTCCKYFILYASFYRYWRGTAEWRVIALPVHFTWQYNRLITNRWPPIAYFFLQLVTQVRSSSQKSRNNFMKTFNFPIRQRKEWRNQSCSEVIQCNDLAIFERVLC